MTGWRIGYTAAPENLVYAINKIQSHTTSHASSISQYAATEAIGGSQNVISERVKEFKKRRDYFYQELTSIQGITCNKPGGAFYLFPNISSYLRSSSKASKVENSYSFAMNLLNNAYIAVIPGSVFGKEGYLRLSYATSMNELQEAIFRLKKALNKVK